MIGEKHSVRGRRDMESKDLGSSSGSEDGSDVGLSVEEKECMNAKMFLQTQKDNENISLYDHLSEIITKCLNGELNGGLDKLEELSQTMKMQRFKMPAAPIKDHVKTTPTETLAKSQWKLLKKSPTVVKSDLDPLEEGEERSRSVPDILRQAAFFELAGVGIPREENVRISLALSDLLNDYTSIRTIRFWGKILGLTKNYYVAETEFGEDDYEEEDMANEAEHEELPVDLREEDSSLFDDLMLPDDIKPIYKPPPKIPCEPAGSGLNKKIYFVTLEPGLPWIRLPHVTPAQIQGARKIRKFFTGDLDAQVITSPPFPGAEKNYLRAQIARITASTQVSPLGYYRFDDEGEEEEAEEAGGRGDIIMDTEFEGVNIRELADTSLQSWVHHSQVILPQGRTTWWNPVQSKEFNEEDEEEDEEEERNEPDEPEPESGPPLLTPLAEDENVGVSPPWIANTSSKFVPEYAIAVLQSNVWIGAMAFAAEKGKYFENLYIGWGQKNLEAEFEPALPDPPMNEFPSGAEVTESDDPTPEEEAAVRAALQEKQLEAEFSQNLEEADSEDEED
ncbi:Radial spoke head protein 4 A [Mactra antiquata]